jgi:pimeloyl-ACP methyl ester carboxylesterase
MFVKLQTLYAYGEPSETKLEFVKDGSSFTLACDRSLATRGAVAIGSRAAFVIKVSCESAGRPRAGTAVWVHGGPFRPYDEEIGPEQAALLSLGYDLLVPLYPGSSDREFGFGDDILPLTMNDAVEEITTTVRWAQKRDRRVLLVGESFGALLAGAAASTLRRSDRLILENPMLLSPRQRTPLPKGAGEPPMATMVVKGVDLMNGLSAEQQNELIVKTYNVFMADWLDRDLISILRGRPPHRMFVIYGDSDSRIGLERMPELLTLGERRYPALVLKDSNHAALGTRAELDAFVEMLRE